MKKILECQQKHQNTYFQRTAGEGCNMENIIAKIASISDVDIIVAKQRGYQSLRLLADKKHTPANKLYQSLNFQYKGAAHLYETDFNAYELIL